VAGAENANAGHAYKHANMKLEHACNIG